MNLRLCWRLDSKRREEEERRKIRESEENMRGVRKIPKPGQADSTFQIIKLFCLQGDKTPQKALNTSKACLSSKTCFLMGDNNGLIFCYPALSCSSSVMYLQLSAHNQPPKLCLL